MTTLVKLPSCKDTSYYYINPEHVILVCDASSLNIKEAKTEIVVTEYEGNSGGFGSAKYLTSLDVDTVAHLLAGTIVSYNDNISSEEKSD